MQDADHIKSKCPKCGAERFHPCIRNDGQIAEKVHYGRPYWSERLEANRQRLRPAEPPPWHWDNCGHCGARMLASDHKPATCVLCR